LLACPERFVREHKVICLPHNTYAALPGGMYQLYGWQWLLGGESLVRAWRFWLYAAILAVLWRIGAALGDRDAGLAAAVLFGTMPLFAYHVMHVKDDAEAAFLALLAVLAIAETRRRRRRRGRSAPPIAALLAGQAVAIKLTSVVCSPWLLLAAALPGPARGRGGRLLLAGAVAGACLAPWLARNTLEHANPIYPFATGVFRHGRQLNPVFKIRMGQELSEPVRPAAGQPFGMILALFEKVSRESGPAVAIALPFVLLWPLPSGAGAIRFVTIASGASWVALTNYPRFGLVPWALVILIASLVMRRFVRGLHHAAPAFGGLVVLVGALNLGAVFPVWRGEFGGSDLLLGRLHPRSIVRQRVPRGPWTLLDRLGARLPRGATVLLAGDHRALYWPVRTVNQSFFDTHLLDRIVKESGDERRAAVRLRQLATHVYLNDDEAARLKFTYRYPLLHFDNRDRALLRRLWSRWMDATGREGPAGLYAVRHSSRASGPGPRLPLCLDEPALERRMHVVPTVTWQ
ncbi:MAG: hypothetical protein AAB368_07230, partial [bacterium]